MQNTKRLAKGASTTDIEIMSVRKKTSKLTPFEEDVLIGEILGPLDDGDAGFHDRGSQYDDDQAQQKAEKDRKKVESGFWKTVRKAAGRIPFMEDVIAAYYCALDPDTPFRVRGILLAALAYFVLPLDSIPDFLIGFGFTDDITVLTVAITTLKGHIQERHQALARQSLAEYSDDEADSASNREPG